MADESCEVEQDWRLARTWGSVAVRSDSVEGGGAEGTRLHQDVLSDGREASAQSMSIPGSAWAHRGVKGARPGFPNPCDVTLIVLSSASPPSHPPLSIYKTQLPITAFSDVGEFYPLELALWTPKTETLRL